MKMLKGFFLLILCLPAYAEIYQWIDENGKRHFSDRKPEKNYQLKTLKPKVNSYQSVSYEDYPFTVRDSKKSNKDIVMYSASWCGYCRKARNYFNQNNIAFTEYDVEKSARGKADYKKLNASGVPVILVGDKRMNGFSASRFEYLYGI